MFPIGLLVLLVFLGRGSIVFSVFSMVLKVVLFPFCGLPGFL